MSPRSTHLYTVKYRRRGWKQRQHRAFKDKRAANRLTKKLLLGDPSLAPVVELEVERRELGPPETVWTLGGQA